jgi:hypothetical protein
LRQEAKGLFWAVFVTSLFVAGPSAFAGAKEQPRSYAGQSAAEQPLEPRAPTDRQAPSILDLAAKAGETVKTESYCFVIGTDEPPAKDQKLVIPRQMICPFVRLPEARQEPR